MSNKYKKYFDNISPDKKLTEETIQKMHEELNRKGVKNFNIAPFAVAAACIAVTASAIIFAPDLKKEINIDSIMTDKEAVETVSETTVTTVSRSESSSVSKTTGEMIISSSYSSDGSQSAFVSSTEQVCTDSVVSNSATTTEPVVVSSQTTSYTVTRVPVSSTSVSSSKVTSIYSTPESTEVTTIPSVSETEAVLTTETVISETLSSSYSEESMPETTLPNLRPGNPNGDMEVTTVPAYSEAPTCSSNVVTTNVSAGESYYDTVWVGYTEINVNYGFEYNYAYPYTADRISIRDAEELMDCSFTPSVLKEGFPETTGVYTRNDKSFRNGICFTFGEETSLDRKSGRFVSMAVSKENLLLGYEASYLNPVYSQVDDKNIIFGTAGGFDDVYFSSFEYNGINYRFLFKGYTPEEMIQTIRSL